LEVGGYGCAALSDGMQTRNFCPWAAVKKGERASVDAQAIMQSDGKNVRLWHEVD